MLIKQPPPPMRAAIFAEVDKKLYPTEDIVLVHAMAEAGWELNKADN